MLSSLMLETKRPRDWVSDWDIWLSVALDICIPPATVAEQAGDDNLAAIAPAKNTSPAWRVPPPRRVPPSQPTDCRFLMLPKRREDPARDLDELAAGRHRQHCYDPVAAHGNHAIKHVNDDADMVRHHANHLADLGSVVAARKIEEPMFLGEGVNLGLWVFQDQAEAIVQSARVGRQCLGAGVENAALGCGAADDGGVDAEGAVVRRCSSTRQHHAVVEDVGAGAVLRGAGKLPHVDKIGRTAGRDDAGLEAGLAHAAEGLAVEVLRLRPGLLGGIE